MRLCQATLLSASDQVGFINLSRCHEATNLAISVFGRIRYPLYVLKTYERKKNVFTLCSITQYLHSKFPFLISPQPGLTSMTMTILAYKSKKVYEAKLV